MFINVVYGCPLESILHISFFPGHVLESIPNELLINNELPAKFFVADVDAKEGTLPNHLVTLLNHLGPMLKSESRSIQLASFSLLERYVHAETKLYTLFLGKTTLNTFFPILWIWLYTFNSTLF